MSDPVIQLSTRAICSTHDVKRLVPGYEFDEPTEEVITDLINAESDILNGKREFTPITTGSSERLFDLTDYMIRKRTIPIGDCATITLVTVKQLDGTVLETIATANRVSLPRVRQAWQPIESIWFPTTGVTSPATMLGGLYAGWDGSIAAGRVLAVTGTWGFPSVPDKLRVACAKLVLSRYIVEYPNTALAEGAADLNTSSMYASSIEVVQRLARKGAV